ncbi:hypothetical protein [Lentilactobacillus sp. Marseille-Q4993]|uniref:hypothetical protein n=1 Tax=Lentilactobacillus sp. Marseille-Q4993 TaxID=3039492 RepID=UPI0024BD4B0A|nr:hypothetical protein [Lentilactobacillus sp. Marseille-Q4993]
MLTVYINGNEGNQEVKLSDGTLGQLSGVRISGTTMNSFANTVQWTFASVGRRHEGFVYSGEFFDGQVIKSINGNDTYRLRFV